MCSGQCTAFQHMHLLRKMNSVKQFPAYSALPVIEAGLLHGSIPTNKPELESVTFPKNGEIVLSS